MTADAMASDQQQCLDVGMNDYVAKPINPQQFFSVLSRWIAHGGDDIKAVPKEEPARPSIPSIPGIDTGSGLKQTGDKRDRYESLLREFAKQEADAVKQMRSALAAGDPVTAQRRAHSLKGAAGTLGATALSEAAAGAEAAIKNGRGVDKALRSLSVSIKTVVQGISAVLPAEISIETTHQDSADPAAVIEPLSQLKLLLENHDGAAVKFTVQARPSLARVLTRSEIETLSELVGKYDFVAARKCIADIAARLSLDLR
jgi:HPt (histidine-containing phosphotransfer) domain-containing protein